MLFKISIGGMVMKFVKGMVLGTMVSAGVLMMWADTKNTRNMMMKKGRRVMKRIKNMY